MENNIEPETSERLYFTRRGLAILHNKIEELKEKLRDLESQAAHIAEVSGDQWHDNPTYNSLEIDIRSIDHRIFNERQVLNKAILVEAPINFDRVAIGTKVKISRDSEEITLEIAGFGESDPGRNAIAYNTPLASLIMGRRKGEVVSGIIAGKKTEIEILEIAKRDEENVCDS